MEEGGAVLDYELERQLCDSYKSKNLFVNDSAESTHKSTYVAFFTAKDFQGDLPAGLVLKKWQPWSERSNEEWEKVDRQPKEEVLDKIFEDAFAQSIFGNFILDETSLLRAAPPTGDGAGDIQDE